MSLIIAKLQGVRDKELVSMIMAVNSQMSMNSVSSIWGHMKCTYKRSTDTLKAYFKCLLRFLFKGWIIPPKKVENYSIYFEAYKTL